MAYNPVTDTPGLIHYWKAAQSGATDGSTVSPLPDLAASPAPLTAGTGANRPVYRPNGFAAGAPAAEYPSPLTNPDGPPYYNLTTTLLSGLSALTFSVVATMKTGNAAAATLWSAELQAKVDLTAAQNPRLLVSNNGTSWAVNTTAASAITQGVPHVFTVVVGGGTAQLRIDGTQVISQAFTGTIGANSSAFGLGAVNDTGSVVWKGLIGDAVVSNQALSGTNLTNLESYLTSTTVATTVGSGFYTAVAGAYVPLQMYLDGGF